MLLLLVGCLVGDLVGLDGSFVRMFVGLFTFIMGENVGHYELRRSNGMLVYESVVILCCIEFVV